MKSERDCGKSRNGRINQARKYVRALSSLLDGYEVAAAAPHFDGPFWGAVRELSEKATKCLHEANAYNNVMCGDTGDDDDPLFVTRTKNGEERAA